MPIDELLASVVADAKQTIANEATEDAGRIEDICRSKVNARRPEVMEQFILSVQNEVAGK